MREPLDPDAISALIERVRVLRTAEADIAKEARVLSDRRREAISEQHDALDRLASAGVPLTVVAHRVAMLDHRVLDVAQRQREAARLRQRRRRSRVTGRHADPAAPTPRGGSPSLPSNDTTKAAKSGVEKTMPILVKRIVEHYELDPLEDEVVTDDLDEDDDEEVEEEDESEKKRTRRSPRTKC